MDWDRATVAASLRRLEAAGSGWVDHGTTSEAAVLRNRDGSRLFVGFRPAEKTVVRRNLFAAWLLRQEAVETMGSRPAVDPELLATAAEPPAVTLSQGLVGWLRLTAAALVYAWQTLFRLPRTEHETRRLDDRRLRLEVLLDFTYTLDFLQQAGIDRRNAPDVRAFLEKHPELPVLCRAGGGSTAEKVKLPLIFDNTSRGPRP